MATKFRVYKQLFASTPKIWVAKLDTNDMVDEFDTLEEAEDFAQQATQLDTTGRKYRVQEVEVGT